MIKRINKTPKTEQKVFFQVLVHSEHNTGHCSSPGQSLSNCESLDRKHMDQDHEWSKIFDQFRQGYQQRFFCYQQPTWD